MVTLGDGRANAKGHHREPWITDDQISPIHG